MPQGDEKNCLKCLTHKVVREFFASLLAKLAPPLPEKMLAAPINGRASGSVVG
jgi:hypothetical protein